MCFCAVITVVGCVVPVSDFAGKRCEAAEDCPDPYVCVAVRPGAGRTCEALRSPEVADGGGIDPGPVPTWCADIQPILAANCISSCHGVDSSTSQRTDFRLDYYAPDAGEPAGAKAMASRIKVRAVDFQDMPPLGNPMPTSSERALIGQWVEGGAPFCTDAGSPDAGTDGGP